MMFTGCRKGMMDETQEGASERANMGKGTVLREETALVQQCFASVQKLPRLWAEYACPSWLRLRRRRCCSKTHLKFQNGLLLCPTGQTLTSSLNTQDDRGQTGI